MKKYDVIIIGAGAAGLSAASIITKRSKRVAVIEMGTKPARKVLASGGGRCNFTNDAVSVNKYFGSNPDFVRSAITRIQPIDILNWLKEKKIKYIEKQPGQYFCKNSSSDIVDVLLKETKNADIFTNTKIINVSFSNDEFILTATNDTFICKSIIVATGGISFSSLGVSDFGYKIAKQFGHKIIPIRPALCAISTNLFSSELSGISLKVEITVNKEKITDDMLFTHFGIGGPAIYHTSVRDFNEFHINLMPDTDVYKFLCDAKRINGKKTVYNVLSEKLPMRVAKWICSEQKNIADYKDKELYDISEKIRKVIIYRKDIKFHNLQSAEVARGGIDTAEVSSKTMESKLQPGLFFAGEVLDVTGDLGGFNLHWAWASGRIAGQNA